MDGIGRMAVAQGLGAAQHRVDVHQHPMMLGDHDVEAVENGPGTEQCENDQQDGIAEQGPQNGKRRPLIAVEIVALAQVLEDLLARLVVDVAKVERASPASVMRTLTTSPR